MENNSMDYLPKKKWWERLLAFALIIVIIALTFLAVRYLTTSKPKPKKKAPQQMKAVVETEKVAAGNFTLTIESFGIVKASDSLTLTPEISGKIIYLSDTVIPGNIIKKGTLIAKIDDTDYKNQVIKAEASLRKAEADYKLELGSSDVAKKELELAKNLNILDNSSADLSIALRKPQLLKAKAAVELAEAELMIAKNNLLKTSIYAPFDIVVTEKGTSLGSYVSPSSALLKGFNKNEVWIEANIPYYQLKFLDIENQKQKDVIITNLNDTTGYTFKGKFLKLLPQTESNGLLSKVLMKVDSPFKNLSNPLLVNNKVKVIFKGVTLKNVYRIKSEFIRDNNTLYIFKDKKLKIVKINILYSDENYTYIDAGLNDGDKIITTNIHNAIEGLQVEEVKLSNE
ncbi:efflux RND transporter periplasmic adaptor subunit [Deferribacterales bacterium Es71-Z0220]|uniref:efflux RND transporter periplasmic adaptor subunit n=1 Tax=Deferrivibrio essentukiensis TaxID=2880922 RepID=UPI001F621529|nr:efflux RND transporter periplasmic adaptor subunit [Deferrivibrio essentukiensis]MCB4204392.1 efflux RND transporter periplasmic adaptor subunit [Deferrivibrio essentukiensis]